MAYRNGDIVLSANFNLAAAIPLRSGDVVVSVTDLESIPSIERFTGRPTWVIEEKTIYFQNDDLLTWSFLKVEVSSGLENKILYGGQLFQEGLPPGEFYVDSPDNRGSAWLIESVLNQSTRVYFTLPAQDEELYRKCLVVLGENNTISLLVGELGEIPLPPTYDASKVIVIGDILITPDGIDIGEDPKSHVQNTDDFLGFGTAFQSSKEEIRAMLDAGRYTDEEAILAIYNAWIDDPKGVQLVYDEETQTLKGLFPPGIVRSVNGVPPDETGNVTIEVGEGGTSESPVSSIRTLSSNPTITSTETDLPYDCTDGEITISLTTLTKRNGREVSFYKVDNVNNLVITGTGYNSNTDTLTSTNDHQTYKCDGTFWLLK